MTKIGDINLVLSLLKCLDEEMHLLKFEHTHEVKQRFTKMMKAAQHYERAVYKNIKEYNPNKVEKTYDALMDCVLESNEKIIEE